MVVQLVAALKLSSPYNPPFLLTVPTNQEIFTKNNINDLRRNQDWIDKILIIP